MEFHAQADIVVIGTNPEAADYDNPRGEIFAMASYVVATDATGKRVALHVVTDVSEAVALAPARKLAAALTARFEKLGKLPVAFASWGYTYPAYGSDAWHEENENGDLAAWEREVEERANW